MTDTIVILAGGILALVVVILVVLRSNPPAEQKQPPRPAVPPRESSPPRDAVPRPAATASAEGMTHDQFDKFRGGMIFPQPDPCGPVTLMRGKTFPEGRVPGIPVSGCNRQRCDCQVHVVVGRRKGPRRLDADRRDDMRINDDRRSGRDRRSA